MELKNVFNVQVVASAFPVSMKEFASSFILNEVLALQEAEVRSYVTTCRYGDDVNLDGIRVHRIARRRLDLPSYISRLLGLPEMLVFPKAVFLKPLAAYCISRYKDEIVHEAKMHHVDLIHAHFAYPDGYAAMLAKKILRKPLVISLRGCDILTEPSIKYGVRLTRHLESYVRDAILFADKIMVASRAEYNEAVKIGVDVENIALVPNGVNIDKFNPNTDGQVVRKRFGLKDNLIVLFVGTLDPVKGTKYLLESVPIVLSEVPNVTFFIVGEGPERGFLEGLVKKLGVSESVIFTGRLEHSEIPLFLAACDLFVLPSLSEGFSNATLEAMASGKPVIGTNIHGTIDQIRDGINGYLIESKNSYELADRVMRLLSDPEKREAMGKEGRKIVEHEFNMSLRVRRTIEVYQSVLQLAFNQHATAN